MVQVSREGENTMKKRLKVFQARLHVAFYPAQSFGCKYRCAWALDGLTLCGAFFLTKTIKLTQSRRGKGLKKRGEVAWSEKDRLLCLYSFLVFFKVDDDGVVFSFQESNERN